MGAKIWRIPMKIDKQKKAEEIMDKLFPEDDFTYKYSTTSRTGTKWNAINDWLTVSGYSHGTNYATSMI